MIIDTKFVVYSLALFLLVLAAAMIFGHLGILSMAQSGSPDDGYAYASHAHMDAVVEVTW